MESCNFVTIIKNTIMPHAAPLLILIFLAITFIQSGYDKFTDWNGNVSWLQQHFSKTFLATKVPVSLMLILVLEIISSVLCAVGIVQLLVYGHTAFGLCGMYASCITLLFLLIGQRIAKDYDGARTIVIYFIPAVMGVYWLG
jgi:uncharacterized membrane protein YphA (DoxX/SURF4 family)